MLPQGQEGHRPARQCDRTNRNERPGTTGDGQAGDPGRGQHDCPDDRAGRQHPARPGGPTARLEGPDGYVGRRGGDRADHDHRLDHQAHQKTQQAAAATPRVTAEQNGGIQVSTWDKPEVELKLCKQVAATDDNEARKVLAETRLEINGSKISIHTPEGVHHSLGTLLIVKAPKGADLNLSVHNGGVSLNNFIGTAEAHAQNGGISFRRSSGKLTAIAQNGGVSIKDCGGEVNAQVENGGLSIALPERWEGKGLDARAHNGGLVVSVPKTFNGGLEVAASEHTSIICKDEICKAGERTWENGRKLFRMGGANPQVRASTENGGIVLESRGSSHGEL